MIQYREIRRRSVPPIRAESVLMALTKGSPEPTEPDWSTEDEEEERKMGEIERRHGNKTKGGKKQKM